MVTTQNQGSTDRHDPEDLIRLFNQLFDISENTRLVRGDQEPIYIPANAQTTYHQVVFAHGYFASALHEIAHWCIAGKQRRQQEDYGYWYAPDGRDAQQQQAFEQVEVKPQALEWILSKACNKPFRVSVDNLNGTTTDSQPFKLAVFQQVASYCQRGIPSRARRLRDALSRRYNTPGSLSIGQFSPAEIGLNVTEPVAVTDRVISG